ncbi:MAG: AAA family ATPase, partial [Cyanobacteria bacterium P01_F01_bin.4]
PEMTQKTYDRLLTLGLKLAQAGYSVILDAKYDRQALRQPVIAAAGKLNLPLSILHCTAPDETLNARIAKRSGDIADATVDVLAKQSMEPFSAEVQAQVQTIDTTQSLENQVAGIVEALAR